MAAVYDLRGKIALVTGAARGIGFETARMIHDRGGSVALLDLNEDATRGAAAGLGERTLTITADVTDRQAMRDAVAQTVERFGGLDVAVANAGVAPPVATTRMIDEETWERVLNVDLLGVWRTVRPALPQVVQRRGQVVLVSSVYAWFNGALASPYAVAKAGVEQLGRALRVELSPLGASATVAHFSFVDTRMLRDSLSDPLAQRMEEMVPSWTIRRISPERAAARIVRALENRAPRVIVPGWWKVWFALRGVLNPLHDRAMVRDDRLLALLREADSHERGGLRGGLDEAPERA